MTPITSNTTTNKRVGPRRMLSGKSDGSTVRTQKVVSATGMKRLPKLAMRSPKNSTPVRASTVPDGAGRPTISPLEYHDANKLGIAEIPAMTSQAATTMRRLHANRPRTKRDDAPIAVEPIIGWMALRTTEKLQRTRIQTMATANGANMMHAIMAENADADLPT